MARSNFGGGGDYSSLFGSLYSQAKALKEQQQDSRDKDAYDRWKNGLSSDEQWLDYIQARVDATAGDKDPTDHQHWIQLQRQYVVSIADSQAEYAYSEGDASINELIAYYQGRLNRLQEDSDEYRQIKGHLNQLVDKRDSDDLSTGAQAIMSKIDRGLATYEDLLKFYRSHLGGLRAGSELHKQVTAEIGKVRDTIAETKLAGAFERLKYLYEANKLSGRAYARKLEAMARPYKDSDPQRYYQILEAANRVRKAGGTGGSGSGGGGGGGGRFAPGWNAKERNLEDRLKGIDNYLDAFTDAYRDGARVIPDPMNPGKQIVLSPELMSAIDEQRLANFDKLASLYKSNKDNYHYRTTLEGKTKYIVQVVQPHNTVEASQQWGQLVGAAQKQIASMANNPDPEASLKGVVSSFEAMQRWLRSQVVQTTPRGQGRGATSELVASEDQPTGDFMENSSQFIDQALAILGDPEMDSASRMAAVEDLVGQLDTDTDANYDRGTRRAMKDLLTQSAAIASASYDLANGTKVLAITPDKGITLVDTRIQHTLAADPATGQMVNVDVVVPDLPSADGQRLQEVWIDRGGTPTKVFAVVDSAPSPYKAWVATKKVTISGKTFAAGAVIPSSMLSNAAFEAAVQSGSVERQDAFAAAGAPLKYIVVPEYDDNGKTHASVTWYQDPQTKLWYKGQPPISSASLNDDGTVKIGDDGKIGINWRAYANVGGVVTPYTGSNTRAMQDLYDQGAVGTDPRYNEPTGVRDFAGNYTSDPSKSIDGGPMYFDQRDESNRYQTYAPHDSAARAAFAQQEKIDEAKRLAGMNRSGSPDDRDDFAAQMQKMAADLGIELGIMQDAKRQRASRVVGVPEPTAPVLDARRKALERTALAPKVGLIAASENRFDVPVSARVSSGPALADLPTASARKIDVSKVVAKPLMAKDPELQTKPRTSVSAPRPALDAAVQETNITRATRAGLY